MIIKTSEFVVSNTDVSKCPKPVLPEYAFIGRSNVGKSSLINMLTNNNNLAKISSSPGKTQLINHFLINDSWFLVDLPGYGYAKVSKKKREVWSKFISKYILTRENLMCLFVLIDSRLEPQLIDLELMEQLGINHIPFVILFTKIDKISKNELMSNIAKMRSTMLRIWEDTPQFIITSSKTNKGREKILTYIEELNQKFYEED